METMQERTSLQDLASKQQIIRHLQQRASAYPNFKAPISRNFCVKRMLLEYANEDIRRQIIEISEKVPLYRKSRGDGNCFYRAFFFYYIEKLISSQQFDNLYSYIEQIERKIITIKVLDENSQDFLELDQKTKYDYQQSEIFFIDCLKILIATSKSSRFYIAEYLRILMTEITAFDMAGILFVRMIALQGLEKYNEKLIPYTFDLLRTPTQLVQTYGTEGELVIAMAVSLILEVNINAMELKKGGNNSWQINKETFLQDSKTDKEDQFDIYLLYRQGHYDLCYSKSVVLRSYKNQLDKEEKQVYQILDIISRDKKKYWQCLYCLQIKPEEEELQHDNGCCSNCSKNQQKQVIAKDDTIIIKYLINLIQNA